MVAAFAWDEDNGAQTGSPTKGTTRNAGETSVNWKNADDVATAAFPLVADRSWIAFLKVA